MILFYSKILQIGKLAYGLLWNMHMCISTIYVLNVLHYVLTKWSLGYKFDGRITWFSWSNLVLGNDPELIVILLNKVGYCHCSLGNQSSVDPDPASALFPFLHSVSNDTASSIWGRWCPVECYAVLVNITDLWHTRWTWGLNRYQRHFTWFALSCFIDSTDAELNILPFLQTLDSERCSVDGVCDRSPATRFVLLLQDVACDVRTTVRSWRCPRELNWCWRDSLDLGCTRFLRDVWIVSKKSRKHEISKDMRY